MFEINKTEVCCYLYKNGVSLKNAAEITNLSYYPIYRKLKFYKKTGPKKPELKRFAKTSKNERKKVKFLLDSGFSLGEISEIMGINGDAIIKIVNS